MKQRDWRDWALLATLVLVWGSSFAVNKTAVETISPEWVVALRLVVAAAVLVPLVYFAGRRLPRAPSTWAWFTVLALIGNIFPFWLISWGTQFIPSGLAGILMSLSPLAVIVLAHLALPDERLTFAKAAGFLIGLGGVVILLGPQNIIALSVQGIIFWAQIAVLLAALFYALHSVVARRMPRVEVYELGAGVSLVGAAIALLLAVISSPAGLATASVASLASSVALGLFPTALALIVLYSLLARAGAGFVSMCNYMIPAFAAILGAAALGEFIPSRAVLGLILILSGIAVTEFRFRRFR